MSEVFYRRSGGSPGGRSSERARSRRRSTSADMIRFRARRRLPRTSSTTSGFRCRASTAAFCRPPDRGCSRRTGCSVGRASSDASPGACAALLERMDAIVTLSEHGARRLRDEAGVDGRAGARDPSRRLDYLTRLPDEAPLPDELAAVEEPVVLCFGLIRPYKGVDVLLEAFRSIERRGALGRRTAARGLVGRAAEGGGVGRGSRAVRAPVRLRQRAPGLLSPRRPGGAPAPRGRAVGRPVRGACVREGDRDERRRGIRGGRRARRGAARAAGRRRGALASAIEDLLADPEARERLAASAREAAAGPYSWDAVAEQTMALYGELARVTSWTIAFWASVGLLVYTHLGYPALLWALARARRATEPPRSRRRAAAERVADRRRARRGGGHRAPRSERSTLASTTRATGSR